MYMKITIAFLLLLSTCTTMYAVSSTRSDFTYTPWLVGPFLAPTPINMDPKHPALESSLTIFNTYGQYSAHWKPERQDVILAINPLIDFQFGITNDLGVELLISSISNFQKENTATYFQDLQILFGYQILNDIRGSWVPDCRFVIQETFPTGNYQKLNPKKNRIDSTGQGAFQTGPQFVFRKRFHLPKSFFSLQWSVQYLFPTTVHVKDFNTYGGGYGTRGTVRPGQTFTAFLSGEYSFNQNWVFAFDTEFVCQKSSYFSGTHGVSALGEPAFVGLPFSTQLSFAPEIEYNFSSNSGIVSGIWGTLAGKNSAAFASFFFSYLYVF